MTKEELQQLEEKFQELHARLDIALAAIKISNELINKSK